MADTQMPNGLDRFCQWAQRHAAWCVLAGLMLGGSAHAETVRAQVVRVVDGDTLWVQLGVNVQSAVTAPAAPAVKKQRMVKADYAHWQKVRIEGIDAPEICQPFGDNARRHLEQLVLNRPVLLDMVAQDRYGRQLARVYLDQQDVGRLQVQAGMAWSYHRRFGDRGDYADEEGDAQDQRMGLFADEDAQYPASFRRRHGPCYAPPSAAGARQ